MSMLLRIMLILFGLAYLISPVDLIPDLLVPWMGWSDDGLVIWSIYHLIRHGDLPWFMFKRTGKTGQSRTARKTGPAAPSQDSRSGTDTPRPKANPPAHEILGVAADAPWDQIQQAYREKIKQYHPDRLSHLGEEFSTLANEKFLEIQAAYRELKIRHGRS